MTPTTDHSRAAAHYTGLLDQLHGEQIMEALRELERATKANAACDQAVADYPPEIVERMFPGSIVEDRHQDLKTAQITLWRVLGNAGFDAAVIREGMGS